MNNILLVNNSINNKTEELERRKLKENSHLNPGGPVLRSASGERKFVTCVRKKYRIVEGEKEEEKEEEKKEESNKRFERIAEGKTVPKRLPL